MSDAPIGDPSPRSTARAAAREVAEDLETIFADTVRPQRSPEAARARRRPIRLGGLSGGKVEKGRIRAATLGGLAAAALAGISAGALMTRGSAGLQLPWRSAGPGVAQLYPVRTTAAAATPAPALTPNTPASAQPATLAAPALAAPAAQPLDIAPAVAAADAPAPRELAVRHSSACSSLSRRCQPAAVQAADRRLRRAYAAALRAGVARQVLTSYRRRWTGLAHKANTDPRQVAAAYDHMAHELNRMAAHRPRLHEVSHHSHRRRPLLLRILWPWR